MQNDHRGILALRLLFALLAVMGAIGCVWGRSDYNLPIFAYMWAVFFEIPVDRRKRQQIALILLAALSCLPDVMYILYWPGRWFRKEWVSKPDASRKLHSFVVLLVLAEFMFKIATLLLLLFPRNSPLFACKPDDYDEVEITTFSPTPQGENIYEFF